MNVNPNDTINVNDPEIKYKLIKAISEHENNGKFPYSEALTMAAIKGTGDPAGNMIANTNKFVSAVNKPIAQSANDASSGFLTQTNKMQQQPAKTVNNSVVANIAGININTTANTVTGNIEDATLAATQQMYQLVPTMN